MSDSISRQAVIKINRSYHGQMPNEVNYSIWKEINELPSVQPDNRLEKIADLVEGTIDHFDRDDAMDLLYQIKEVFK